MNNCNSTCAQPPFGLLRGICPPCQSRGWGICKFYTARGNCRAFNTHVVPYQNITTQTVTEGFTGKKSRLAHLSRTGIMYRSNRSFNMPPPGIPQAFDTFTVLGRREFDYQSLPGGGEFDPHALGVGNLNSTLHFM